VVENPAVTKKPPLFKPQTQPATPADLSQQLSPKNINGKHALLKLTQSANSLHSRAAAAASQTVPRGAPLRTSSAAKPISELDCESVYTNTVYEDGSQYQYEILDVKYYMHNGKKKKRVKKKKRRVSSVASMT
jgi:hypothetical protein